MLRELDVLAVIIHLAVLVLAETVERLVGAAIELLRDRDEGLAVGAGRGEADRTGLDEQRRAGGVEEADLPGRERDFGDRLGGGDPHQAGGFGDLERARDGRLRDHQAGGSRCRPAALRNRHDMDDPVAMDAERDARGASVRRRHRHATWGSLEALRVRGDRAQRAAEQQRGYERFHRHSPGWRSGSKDYRTAIGSP